LIQGRRQEEQTEGGEFEDGIDSEELRFDPDFLAFRFASRQRAQVLYSDEAQGQRQRLQKDEAIVDKKSKSNNKKDKLLCPGTPQCPPNFLPQHAQTLP
jgi:hypothetical protein